MNKELEVAVCGGGFAEHVGGGRGSSVQQADQLGLGLGLVQPV